VARYLDDIAPRTLRCAGERVPGGLGQSEDERGMGWIGKGEGVAVLAVALLEQPRLSDLLRVPRAPAARTTVRP